MGRAAYRQYERLFSPEAVVPLMLETYARVVRNGHSVISNHTGNNRHPWSEAVRSTAPALLLFFFEIFSGNQLPFGVSPF
jgi:hypothetical protein